MSLLCAYSLRELCNSPAEVWHWVRAPRPTGGQTALTEGTDKTGSGACMTPLLHQYNNGTSSYPLGIGRDQRRTQHEESK
jgi:hypothetical protein